MRYGTELHRWISDRLGPPPTDNDRPHSHAGMVVLAGWFHRIVQPALARLYGTRAGTGTRLGVARRHSSRRSRQTHGHLARPPRLWRAWRRGSTPPTWRWSISLVPLPHGTGTQRGG